MPTRESVLQPNVAIPMPDMVNPFDLAGRWYKANLHTHTTASDGQATLDHRVQQYRRAGYAVLAITDHGAAIDVAGLSDRRMLVLGGLEYHPSGPRSQLYHLIGLNVPRGFSVRNAEDANAGIAGVAAAGGATVLAHPSWCGMGYEDFADLRGLVALEVYNATCDRHARASSESEWAIAMDRGMFLPGVGVDDTHLADSGDVFEAWTWLKMPALSAANVLKAIGTGACYATRGPKVHYFGISGGKVRLRCSPAACIHLVGGPGQGRRRLADAGKAVAALTMPVPDWPYVRAIVTAPDGRRAWTNPIRLRK